MYRNDLVSSVRQPFIRDGEVPVDGDEMASLRDARPTAYRFCDFDPRDPVIHGLVLCVLCHDEAVARYHAAVYTGNYITYLYLSFISIARAPRLAAL